MSEGSAIPSYGAFWAAYNYLRSYWLDHGKTDDLGILLGQVACDLGDKPVDPALWGDWLTALAIASGTTREVAQADQLRRFREWQAAVAAADRPGVRRMPNKDDVLSAELAHAALQELIREWWATCGRPDDVGELLAWLDVARREQRGPAWEGWLECLAMARGKILRIATTSQGAAGMGEAPVSRPAGPVPSGGAAPPEGPSAACAEGTDPAAGGDAPKD